jgi:hypothetical protein
LSTENAFVSALTKHKKSNCVKKKKKNQKCARLSDLEIGDKRFELFKADSKVIGMIFWPAFLQGVFQQRARKATF